MPQKVWAVGEEALAADWNTYLQQQVVPQFTSTAQRDAQWVAPPKGALCVTTDTLTTWQYDGTNWVAPALNGALRTIAESVIVGTRGAGSIVAETVIGPTLTFPARAGAQYYALLTGLMNTTGSTNQHTVRVRSGTTTAGTQLAYGYGVVSAAISYFVTWMMPLQGLVVPGANTVCVTLQAVNASSFGAPAPYTNVFAILERV